MLWVIKGKKRRKINDDMKQAFIDRGWIVYHEELKLTNSKNIFYDLNDSDPPQQLTDIEEPKPLRKLKKITQGGTL